jgi:hypothetical protein
LGLLFFVNCINGLPTITDSDAKVVFFTDVVTNFNQGKFQTPLKNTLSDIISWFKTNFLSLKFNKTYYLEFRTKYCIDITLDINYFNNSIANVTYTKFLGLGFDDTLLWDNHIDQPISRQNSAFHTIRAVKAMLSRKALRMLYFSYVHSSGIMFGGNTPNIIKIFRMQQQQQQNSEL